MSSVFSENEKTEVFFLWIVLPPGLSIARAFRNTYPGHTQCSPEYTKEDLF